MHHANALKDKLGDCHANSAQLGFHNARLGDALELCGAELLSKDGAFQTMAMAMQNLEDRATRNEDIHQKQMSAVVLKQTLMEAEHAESLIEARHKYEYERCEVRHSADTISRQQQTMYDMEEAHQSELNKKHAELADAMTECDRLKRIASTRELEIQQQAQSQAELRAQELAEMRAVKDRLEKQAVAHRQMMEQQAAQLHQTDSQRLAVEQQLQESCEQRQQLQGELQQLDQVSVDSRNRVKP